MKKSVDILTELDRLSDKLDEMAYYMAVKHYNIAKEINRIEKAKTEIRLAIIDAGMEIPETVKIDELAHYVAEILKHSHKCHCYDKEGCCKNDNS